MKKTRYLTDNVIIVSHGTGMRGEVTRGVTTFPYIWVGALSNCGQREVVIVELGRSSVSAGREKRQSRREGGREGHSQKRIPSTAKRFLQQPPARRSSTRAVKLGTSERVDQAEGTASVQVQSAFHTLTNTPSQQGLHRSSLEESWLWGASFKPAALTCLFTFIIWVPFPFIFLKC